MSEAKRMTDDELKDFKALWNHAPDEVYLEVETRDIRAIFAHIDALTAERDEYKASLNKMGDHLEAAEAKGDAAEAQLREVREALERIAGLPSDKWYMGRSIASDTLARLNQIATPSV